MFGGCVCSVCVLCVWGVVCVYMCMMFFSVCVGLMCVCGVCVFGCVCVCRVVVCACGVNVCCV